MQIKTKAGTKTIVPLTNAERKVFTRMLELDKIRRDNFDLAKQLAEVKNINSRSIVENAVKSHQRLQKSVIDKSSPKISSSGSPAIRKEELNPDFAMRVYGIEPFKEVLVAHSDDAHSEVRTRPFCHETRLAAKDIRDRIQRL